MIYYVVNLFLCLCLGLKSDLVLVCYLILRTLARALGVVHPSSSRLTLLPSRRITMTGA